MWEDGKFRGLVSLLKWPVLWFSLRGLGLKFYKWTAGRWDLSLLECFARTGCLLSFVKECIPYVIGFLWMFIALGVPDVLIHLLLAPRNCFTACEALHLALPAPHHA